MDKQKPKLGNQVSEFQVSKKELIVGSIIATYIAITPYLFTLWEGVPAQKTWDTFLFTYTTIYYFDVQTLVWTILGKLIPLFLLIIWMFTNRNWWYHVLLVPIAMYVYQILTVLNDELEFADENQILYLLPVMAVIIPSIYLLRAKMFNKLNDAGKTMEELEEELKKKPSSFTDYF
ncbi:MAG: hypothetical protein L3J25_02095 [Flavobacteriaceae bacterium]|nr:hypothetical protein [Flavobacteriaceae bacterium]